MRYAVKPVLLFGTLAFGLGACSLANGPADSGFGAPPPGASGTGTSSETADPLQQAVLTTLKTPGVQIVNTGTELVITLPGRGTFQADSAVPMDSVIPDMAALAHVLNEFPDARVDIVGHTDNIGSAANNQTLSQERADALAALLGDDGIAPARINPIGRGESKPLTSNLTEAGRNKNQRMEIIIRRTKG